MTAPYPLLFESLLKTRVWGGDRLRGLGKPVPLDTPIGESWEIADLPATIESGQSRVSNGPWAGRTLRSLMEERGADIIGLAEPASDGGFPLLIKYLDAREDLSVQVHPTPDYVRAHPETAVKSEAWYVVEAAPGASIYKGLRPGVTREQLERHLDDASIVDDLKRVDVAPGDCHNLPSGTCHALGAGVLVAEIQTPSDTTFRLYDWGRGRTLHLEPALACIDFSDTPEQATLSVPPVDADGFRTTSLLETDSFGVERVDITCEEVWDEVTNERPVIWMMLSGTGSMVAGGQRVELMRGRTVLIPSQLEHTRAHVAVGTSFLRITTPDPLRGVLA